MTSIRWENHRFALFESCDETYLGCEGSLLHAHLVEFLEVTRVGLVDSRLLVERPFLSHYSYKKYKQSSVPLHYSSTRIARYNDTDEAGVEDRIWISTRSFDEETGIVL